LAGISQEVSKRFFNHQPLLRCRISPDRKGSFSSDRHAPDALGMSASLRSLPKFGTAANRRGVPARDTNASSGWRSWHLGMDIVLFGANPNEKVAR
jgi:hypothetical protein